MDAPRNLISVKKEEENLLLNLVERIGLLVKNDLANVLIAGFGELSCTSATVKHSPAACRVIVIQPEAAVPYPKFPRLSQRRIARHNGPPDPGVARVKPHDERFCGTHNNKD
ncbi:7543_t:CDS:2 [Funneliformis caledonium]|uniref:7543_t:CDS:1 n=1 Tax=Funneliformis caledonium TaxID=1117310 RepID=A0A9N8ZI13_9GLOM|nr:7543_t:CDS:2 [Funneliformis caledonium]